MSIYQFSIIDILPYFYLLLALLFLTFCNKDKKAVYIIYILLFGFSAVRYGVGYDYFSYLRLMTGELRVEYLSQCIGDLAAYLNIDQVYFIINSFVAIYPIYYVVKRESVDPKISLLLLFLLPFLYLESFSIVRNSSAYAIVFLAIYQLNKGRFLIYLLFVFIASLFHSSGLVGLLFLPFKFIKFNRNITVVIFTISFFAGSFFVDIISLFSPDTYITTKLIAYASNDGGVGRFMKYFIILLNVVNLINWKQLIDFDKRNLLYLNLINIGASLWFALSFDYTLSLRIATFFLMFEILLVPSYFYLYNKKYQKLISQLIVLFFISVFASGFVINIRAYTGSDKMSYIPYQTIFFYQNYSNYD